MIVSHSIFDIKEYKALQVIASFTSKGLMKPIYVRIDGITYQVTSCNKLHENLSIMNFKCTIDNDGFSKTIYPAYPKTEHAWFLTPKYKLSTI